MSPVGHWVDSRNDNYDVYMCEWNSSNHTCEHETVIADDPGVRHFYPAIWGDLVVWWHSYPYPIRNRDVYLYDISTGVTHGIATQQGVYEDYPTMWGNLIVWVRGYDVYLCEWTGASPCTPHRLTDEPATQYQPAIWENRIIWRDYRNTPSGKYWNDVYMCVWDTSTKSCQCDPGSDAGCDEATGHIRLATGAEERQTSPYYLAIWENRVAWYEWTRSGGDYIYLYDIPSRTATSAVSDPHDPYELGLSGDWLVWLDYNVSGRDVWAMDLATMEKVRITDEYSQDYPAMWEGRVVWSDDRNGTDDLYLYELLLPPPERVALLIEDVEQLVLDGTLSEGEGTALTSKLDAAAKSLEKGKNKTATNQLRAFINQVKALVRSGRLSAEEGQTLIDWAQGIIDDLSG